MACGFTTCDAVAGAVFVLVAALCITVRHCSEFPERECCDPIYPPMPNPDPLPPALPTTTTSSSPATPTGRSGPHIKTAIAILNCILARQLCFEDPSCSAILEIIPRVCGPVPVSCSTVTVTKCQAALRTLQAFPFFRPTCLCKEPGIDPDCNYFRDFLFDHPCGFVLKKERDPYPIDALPTCNHALSVCQQERKCISLFDEFKAHCKVRENRCRMEDRDLCHEAWTNLRLSPMFGCICPNNHMKRRCDRIFSMVNHNPCVVRDMGMDDSYQNSIWDENMALIETPLILPANSHFVHNHNIPLYPYNLSAFQGGSGSSSSSQNSGSQSSSHNTIGGGNSGSGSVDNIFIDTMNGNFDENTVFESHAPTNSHQQQTSGQTSSSSSSLGGGIGGYFRVQFQSTCHTALDSCRDDRNCATSLQPVLMHCENHRCNRNACMDALQAFYRGSHEDLSVDLAFCLCKKSPNRHDGCMMALEKIHPQCAQKPPDQLLPPSNGHVYHPPPGCHTVAELCRESPDCRSKLEYYEQSCAVDSVTKKCAGRPSTCRSALIGILGTALRTTCSCQGIDSHQTYECLGWQRLLWLNPCVAEAQKDFHIKRLAELGLLVTTTTTTTIRTTTSSTMRTTPKLPPKPTEFTAIDDNYIEPPHSVPETLVQQGGIGDVEEGEEHEEADLDGNGVAEESHDTIEFVNGISDEQVPVQHHFSTTITVTETDSTSTSTTTVATTTVPTRYCVVQRPHQVDQRIAEGHSRRLYLQDDSECSELCSCTDGGESTSLSCYAICVSPAPCRTALAYYSHASPAYQAFRGRCLCYSGKFICVRPPPGEYTLPGGVFLLVGYSSTDEALLRPHTNLGIQDAVRALQHYMLHHINNQTLCTLSLFNMTDENVIISARLPHDPKISQLELLRREKTQCKSILDKISHHINNQHNDLAGHRLLSIFKMAEMQVVIPEVSHSSRLVVAHLLGIVTLMTSLLGIYNQLFT